MTFAQLTTTVDGTQFWTRPHLVHSTEDEQDDLARGAVTQHRIDVIGTALVLAARALLERPPEGRC